MTCRSVSFERCEPCRCRYLSLSGNELFGDIPGSMGNLTSLEYVEGGLAFAHDWFSYPSLY